MKDIADIASRMVWGIEVPISLRGRCRWPDEIRRMAAERLAAGEPIATLVRETGAAKSVVARWGRETASEVKASGFVEVTVAQAAGPVLDTGPAQALCRLRIGDVDLSIPADFPATSLVGILRAVRAST